MSGGSGAGATAATDGGPGDAGTPEGERRRGLLGLGSNVGGAAVGGGRRAHLQAAVDGLGAAGIEVLASSSVYDTDPVGEVPDQPSFLNACLLVATALEPLALLDAVKALEARLGREAGGVRHGPRAIDIDILLLGDVQLAGERMTLPHEQLLSRRFVLIPALELDFALRAPDGTRLSDALAALDVSEGVRWAGPPLACPAP
ncbi:MAG: 2-amino-4-hydroxy-6-hydroxymethyldihydropteridine diphosphokinase [Solirubrobacteraceae bacterium]|nr:folK [Solirubrobacterales bacterium]MEA2216611.1 2-amino-4-hydroxy-6-hydroxymethyldihydropteridine diphosphokinase [Solirubrobacteraceae bacterium]